MPSYAELPEPSLQIADLRYHTGDVRNEGLIPDISQQNRMWVAFREIPEVKARISVRFDNELKAICQSSEVGKSQRAQAATPPHRLPRKQVSQTIGVPGTHTDRVRNSTIETFSCSNRRCGHLPTVSRVCDPFHPQRLQAIYNVARQFDASHSSISFSCRPFNTGLQESQQ